MESWRGEKNPKIGERRPQQRNPPKKQEMLCCKCKFGYEALDSGFVRSDGVDILQPFDSKNKTKDLRTFENISMS